MLQEGWLELKRNVPYLLLYCHPSEHMRSLKGLSPVFSLETVAGGLWTAGLSDQVRRVPSFIHWLKWFDEG